MVKFKLQLEDIKVTVHEPTDLISYWQVSLVYETPDEIERANILMNKTEANAFMLLIFLAERLEENLDDKKTDALYHELVDELKHRFEGVNPDLIPIP